MTAIDPVESSGRATGGKARAASLTAAQRTAIARRAAQERWTDDLPEAICGSPERPLRIGDTAIQCYVLEDGTRVLTQADFLEALGRHRKANVRREAMPAVLQGKAIRRFITEDVLKKAEPISFRTPSGSRASGYRAELLPAVCEVYLKARDADALPNNQEHVARQAEILMRAPRADCASSPWLTEATRIPGTSKARRCSRGSLSSIINRKRNNPALNKIHTFPETTYYKNARSSGATTLKTTRGDSVKRSPQIPFRARSRTTSSIGGCALEFSKSYGNLHATRTTKSGRRKAPISPETTPRTIGYPKLSGNTWDPSVTLMKLSRSWRDFIDKSTNSTPDTADTLPTFHGTYDGG